MARRNSADAPTSEASQPQLTLAVAGNPNCGKSALFNALTGIRQKTGNWPGVTVDRKEGHFELDGGQVRVYDLPGIYSLDASSLDEQVARDYLLSRDADLILNVVDASNLERNLYLTTQLLEMGVPICLVLNMTDVATKQGIHIDTDKLSQELGCPVIATVAIKRRGLDDIMQAVRAVSSGAATGGYRLAHEEMVEQAIADLLPMLEAKCDQPVANLHWYGLKLLESDQSVTAMCEGDQQILQAVSDWQTRIEERAGEEADIHIADNRFNHAHTLAQHVTRREGELGSTLSDRIDKIVLNRFYGIPIFLLVMYLMFMFTINIGGAFIDFFDIVAGAIFIDAFGNFITAMGLPDLVRVILADGLGGGIQVVATFIPIIAALYLFLSAVEDSGYMARAAFVMDRAMRGIGLPGKAFVPLIVGFGCNVPAVMATRTLESDRERKLTILMNPFMSCGARLPVYALFAAAFFPSNGQNLVFALYIIGILVAILSGLVMKRTILSGTSSGFMMELPAYHAPTLKGIVLRTWDRVRLFIRDAGKVIIIMVLFINVFNSIGTDGSFGNEDSENSVLSAISKQATPVFEPMGIEENNWPAVLGILTGVLAKEVVVGTLDAVYSRLAAEEAGDDAAADTFDFMAAMREAAATVPANLAGVRDVILDPLGLDVGDISSLETAAQEQEVTTGTFGAMVKRFDGQVGAFAYLLFILMYFPCVATIGAIRREAGNSWALFVALWTTGIAYITATCFYQIASFSENSTFASLWLLSCAALLIAVVVGLRSWANKVDPLQVAESRS